MPRSKGRQLKTTPQPGEKSSSCESSGSRTNKAAGAEIKKRRNAPSFVVGESRLLAYWRAGQAVAQTLEIAIKQGVKGQAVQAFIQEGFGNLNTEEAASAAQEAFATER